jgi:hypothetical protein
MMEELDRNKKKFGFRFVVVLCMFAVFVLWQISYAVSVQSYAADVTRDNNAVASRLCGADRRATLLYGVFSTAEKVLWRNATRQQVQCHLNSEVHNTVFVVGAPPTETEHIILRREAAMYGDIFTLSCKENMNEGKTYTYFKEALEQLPCFDFYAKVDDDTAFIPDKISSVVQSVSRSTPAIIGRYEDFHQLDDPLFYIRLYLAHGLRDMSWAYHIRNFTQGQLYILNTAAITRWINLNPTQLYGHEDMRTTYFMKIIGAQVINMHTAFHDHPAAKQNQLTGPITRASMAVHQVKAIDLLTQTFATLCRLDAPA